MERRLGEVEWSPSEQSVRAEDFQVITQLQQYKAARRGSKLTKVKEALDNVSQLLVVSSISPLMRIFFLEVFRVHMSF